MGILQRTVRRVPRQHDIVNGCLIVTQAKSKQPLRISIAGKLTELITRIRTRKAKHKILTAALYFVMHITTYFCIYAHNRISSS